MEQLLVKGGIALKGEVTVSGAKNAALPMLAAALLSQDVCRVENVPIIDDIKVLLDSIEDLGVKIDFEDNGHTVIMDCRKIDKLRVDYEHIKKIRASYYLLGSLLGGYSEAEVAMPGGCNLGARLIDQHIKGFEALGAEVEIEHGMIKTRAKKLKGATIYLDMPSVGATLNIMMAAVKAEGVTTIENPAKEPHIVDVANFLNSMGADVKGAGTDIVRVTGVKKLHGAEYMIIPDMIEAGTYMVAAAITKGDVTIKNLIPKHMEAVVAKLNEMGVGVDEYDDSIRVHYKGPYENIHVKTVPYPGFPTDMHPQFAALMGIVDGVGVMTESIFDSRFNYVAELSRMGADMKIKGNTSLIEGVESYSGAEVSATDLRAGAALVLAGLAAQGETVINNVENIDRGYEHFEDKLRACGGQVYRINSEDSQESFKIV